jgi:hypothetical protein
MEEMSGQPDPQPASLPDPQLASKTEEKRVMITYRVAQAKDLKKRFPDAANYLDLNADHKDEWYPDSAGNLLTALQHRGKFPWIVVQVRPFIPDPSCLADPPCLTYA